MKRSSASAIAVATCLLLLAAVGKAAPRTFVSIKGSNANPCTASAPCRDFSSALVQTDPDGEIIVLDSGGYGPVTINKNVSIVSPPGVYSGIRVLSGTGITVSAPATKVVLRGLTINGRGGNTGVHVQAGEVHLESMVVANFSTGISVDGVAPVRMSIKDTVLRENGSGVFIFQGGGAYVMSIEHSSFLGSTGQSIAGWTAATTGSLKIAINDTVITGAGSSNGAAAFGGAVPAAAPIAVSLVRTKLAGNGSGIGVSSFGAQTFVTLSECQVSGWGVGAEVLNGQSGVGHLQSLNNNLFVDNVSGSSLTVIPPV